MKNKNVVVLHGLYVSKPIMVPLCLYLNSKGYDTLNLNWHPWQKSLEENAAELIPVIREYKIAKGKLNFVGHSMGGLIIRHIWNQAPELFENSRVVTLGTPHNGSEFAKKVYMDMNPFILGQAWQSGLDGTAPSFDLDIPVLSIMGDLDIGLGTMMNMFDRNTRGDGTVTIGDADWTYATKKMVMKETHMSMLYSLNVYMEVVKWFEMRQSSINTLLKKHKEKFLSARSGEGKAEGIPSNIENLGK